MPLDPVFISLLPCTMWFFNLGVDFAKSYRKLFISLNDIDLTYAGSVNRSRLIHMYPFSLDRYSSTDAESCGDYYFRDFCMRVSFILNHWELKENYLNVVTVQIPNFWIIPRVGYKAFVTWYILWIFLSGFCQCWG